MFRCGTLVIRTPLRVLQESGGLVAVAVLRDDAGMRSGSPGQRLRSRIRSMRSVLRRAIADTAPCALLGLLSMLAATALRAQEDLAKLEWNVLRRRVAAETSLSTSERLPALRALGVRPEERAVTVLLELWSSEREAAVREVLLPLLVARNDARLQKLQREVLGDTKESTTNRQLAAGGLAQSSAGVRALLQAFSGRDAELRALARHGLAQATTSGEARKALYASLSEGVGDERLAALSALRGHMKEPPMLKGLRALLTDADPRVCAESLRQLAVQEPAAMHPHALRMAADEVAYAHETLRADLAFALVMSLQPNDAPLLLDLCKEPRSWLGYELQSLPAERRLALGNRLLETLPKDAEAKQRRTALWLLETLGTERQVAEAVTAALADRDPGIVCIGVRLAQNQTLASQNLPARLETLLACKDESIGAVAMLALHAMRKGEAKWTEQLRSMLQGPRQGLRLVAIDLLQELRCREALAQVQACFDAEDWRLRAAAYTFCGAMPDASSVPLLIDRFAVEHGRLAADVGTLLRRFSARTYDGPEPFRQWWAKAGASFTLPESALAVDTSSSHPLPKSGAAVTYHSLPVVSERICFVVDGSSRMSETVGGGQHSRLEVAQQQLLQAVEKLGPEVAIEIVVIGDEAKRWAGGVRALEPQSRQSAAEFILKQRPAGACNVYAGLRAALLDAPVDTIYLLTGGPPTTGEIVDPVLLALEVLLWNRLRRVVIHSVALGTHSDLLRQLAIESGGMVVER